MRLGEKPTNREAIEVLRRTLTRDQSRYIIDTDCSRFNHPALAEALRIWRAHAAPHGIPSHRDLGPQVMRPFLKKVALFEYVERFPGEFDFRARLTGPEFSAAYTEMTGKFFDEVANRKHVSRFRSLAATMLAYRQPFRCLCVPEAFTHEDVTLEFLLAPLLDDSGETRQILFVGNFERHRSWSSVTAEERNATASIASG